MPKNLPPLSDNPPICGREDGVCPAYLAHMQSADEKALGELGQKVANRLGESENVDSEAVKKVKREADRFLVSGEALERQIGVLERQGQLCPNCPYSVRRERG